MSRNYWGYRIDVDLRDYFFKEIQEGRLRQGWGYKKTQDLRSDKVDETARGNLPIFKKVKKGDILLVPRIESWDEVAIVEATEDFDNKDNGYRFEIDPDLEDYGHIFPVRLIRCFSRQNTNVDGDIRETLKCRLRFWNINKCGKQIERILEVNDDSALRSKSGYEDRFRKRVYQSFDEIKFAEDIYTELNKATHASEWEYILCEGFRKVFPEYIIDTTSNKIERDHGADIIIRIPGILDNEYIVAIQVKDYKNKVDNWAVEQISKADDFFRKEGAVLIDKYLIIINAKSDDNNDLIEKANDAGVKILFDEDVKKLLSKMGRAFIGDRIAY